VEFKFVIAVMYRVVLFNKNPGGLAIHLPLLATKTSFIRCEVPTPYTYFN
jgi:hypothetical protein